MVGQVSSALGRAGLKVNEIITMSRGELIYTVADLDAAATASAIAQVAAVKGIVMARMVG
jgi:hypothetical protein